MTRRTTVVVVGAGHNGLAVSRELAGLGVDHTVLERGVVGQSWRTQRWDSLRLLTPNWMTRLPGHAYSGSDPDAYLGAREFADVLDDYAALVAPPLLENVVVTSVGADDSGFVVDTSEGRWRADAVVLATGLTRQRVPAVADALPAGTYSIASTDYRGPDDLPDGGVLVVGASSSGVQIADELRRSGRAVTLATGAHVRLPRTYRGRDILWWLDAVGILDEGIGEVDDLLRVRNLPSMQLVGAARTLDLNTLQADGVRVVGKFAGIRDGLAQFSGSLPNVVSLADLKLNRLLTAIDDFAGGTGERPEPTRVPDSLLSLPLAEFGTVVWATGIKPDHGPVALPVFDHRGAIRHDGGVVDWPGLYVLGLPALRSRRSSLIDGARDDVPAVVGHLSDRLAGLGGGRDRLAQR